MKKIYELFEVFHFEKSVFIVCKTFAIAALLGIFFYNELVYL